MSDRTTAELAVHNQMQIPLFAPGKGSPSIFSAGDMNVHVRILRALTNPQVVWGQRDEARITDGNFKIQLSRDSANAGANSSVQQYVLRDASNGDYFICRTLAKTGSTLIVGTDDIRIVKPFHLRQSIFDRAVLNVAAPGNIGTVDEITYSVQVEAWDGMTFSTGPRYFSFEYKSATFRIATDETDATPANWTFEKQTVIPRFVPVGHTSPTFIYAVNCTGTGVLGPDAAEITLLALNDGWAWAKTA